MVIKKISKAIEGGFEVGANILNLSGKLAGIPLTLIKEASKFVKRNTLIVFRESVENKGKVHVCCDSCLCAHLVTKAEKMGYDNNVKNAIIKVFDNDIGHQGYYMDKERVIKI